MSQVKTTDELFERLDELQEESRKLIHDYLKYVAKRRRRHKKKKQAKSGQTKSIAQIERENDTQCLAKLTNGKRCSGKKEPDGADLDLCKRHNKMTKDVVKVELPPLDDPPIIDDDNEELSEESYDDESSSEEKIAVKLSRDADGDMIDEEGNIWALDQQKIVGKKDLRTKQKVWYKTV